MSKKHRYLADKARRPDIHLSDAELEATKVAARARARSARKRDDHDTDALPPELPPPGTRIIPVTTLYNIHTREALPLMSTSSEPHFHRFLRDHFTNVATRMDIELLGVLTQAARKFSASRVEVVSGYRSPKYNRILRKKGRAVARDSQHTHGNAIDFRIRGVATKTLLEFVRGLRLGGVGYYPNSRFVHADTARVRYWTGS